MEFRVLGSFEVVEDGRRLELGPPKQRAVLAVLVVAANRVVSLDRLIDELWGEEPPPRAIGSLQAYVSNLRRVLEPQRPPREPARVLVTQAPGYVLRVEPHAVDAARFEAAAAEGRRLLEEGRPDLARARLEEALALWRGPALADFVYQGFAQAEAARLEELRLVATEDRLQAALDVGDDAPAVAEAEALVAAHPLRERLWGLLMMSLYRSGRQADALRAYQDARTALGEELGLEPGPALRRLEADILAQAPSLEWCPPPGTPAVISPPATLAPPMPSAAEPERILVGREGELARLEGVLAAAAGGRGGAMLVAGEPGIGKTRLVEEAVTRAEAAGMVAAWGAGLEGGGTPAYWPWVGVVRSLLDRADPDETIAALGAGTVELAQIVPEVKELTGPLDAPPAMDPEMARLRLFEAVAALLDAVGRRRPLAIVLDDLQWADVASLQLVSFLAPRLSQSPLAMVGTYRPAEVSPAHPLTDTLAVLARHQVVTRLELGGLAPADVKALVESTTGERTSAEVVVTVVARTEGNPFFVAELARLLVAEGRLDAEAVATALPAGVRDVLRRRLGRLPEQTTAVLSLAALMGRDFDLDVLESAAELDPERTLELVEAALMSGLVVEHPEAVGRFRFSHDLVRETVAGELSALRRARLHARLARALDALHGGDPEHALALAHHFYAAAPVLGPETAIAPALAAAEVAAARLAHEQAEEQLRRALEVIGRLPAGADRDRRELDVLLRLALLVMGTKGYGAPETGEAFTKAREICGRLGESGRMVPVLYGLAAYHLNTARHDAARELADQLLAVAEASGRPIDLVVAHQAVGVTAQFQGDVMVTRHHFERALALPEGLHDPAILAWFPFHPVVGCWTFLSQALWLLGEEEQAKVLTRRAVDFAAEVDHDLSMAHALDFVAWIHAMDGDVPSARAAAQRAMDFAIEKGFPLYIALNRALLGWAHAQDGETESGISEIEGGLAAMEATGAWMLHTVFLAYLAEAYWKAERPGDALAAVERALALVEPTGERFWEAELHRRRGELLVELFPERAEEAESELHEALAVAREQGAKSLEERAAASLARLANRS
ncbi:MAG: AAA family ATPase [Actinomycetota bacterium]|nr:AAA family ATPase [Actinomycetota bacterium]